MVMNKQEPTIEIGILFALRVFFGLQFALTLLSFIRLFFLDSELSIGASLEETMLHGVALTILLAAVFIPIIRQLMRRTFLPFIITMTVFETYFTVMASMLWQNVEEIISLEASISIRAAQIIIILFVPSMIAAWQYGYRSVNIYAAVNALLMTGTIMAVLRGEPFTVTFISFVIFQVMMYLIVGYMVAWLMSVQRKQRQELIEANEKVRRYALTLEKLAISRERNRLARELHDTLAHTLSGLSVQLEATDALIEREPERAHQLLRSALDIAHSGMVETRTALHALRAEPLEDLGLILSLKNMAKDMAARSAMKIHCQLPDRIPDLPTGVDHVIYRVVQESLTNIARHANAQNATIAIIPRDNCLTVNIMDDGDGFEVENIDTDQQYGIQGIRERVTMIGGNVTISSRVGHGTSIKVELEFSDDKGIN